ncbi:MULTISPECIES: DUF6344 domain-containing protein [unclassified Streptomyces]|uniref:DUF6344 domain-containing protein n=1 Tax=unclassified Streptomyces TaxID=2593676 RepID=UPI003D8B8536
MTGNKVMKLWTAIVTAFLALCTALGLTTRTAAAAVPQAQPERNSNSNGCDSAGVGTSTDEMVPRQSTADWSHKRLPPTMKQRIRAEAHGSSPSCRHRPLTDTSPAIPLARSALESRFDPLVASAELPAHLAH